MRLVGKNGLFNHKNQNKKNAMYEGWNFNSGNYLFTTDTK